MPRQVWNSLHRKLPDWSGPEFAFVEAIRLRAQLPLHRALPGYAATPLLEMPGLARELGLASLAVKDESGRFGIDAFKGLGASYAVYALLRRRWRAETGEDLPPAALSDPALSARLGTLTFCAATDGNHGRAVAWTARRLGQRAVIFMPADSARARVDAIEREGADLRLVAGSFDDCVAECARTAEREGWQVIADTAYAGYLEIPGDIMTGYSTIFAELADQLPARPDAIFLPAGVGGLAAAGTVSCVQRWGAERPRLVCVEPESAACFLESASSGSGKAVRAAGDLSSIMVGLCCGIPSLLAWPVIRDGVDLFLAVEDEFAQDAMRAYHRHGLTAGESGAAALAGLLALLRHPALAPARERMGLGVDSAVLVINTEGATDPAAHARIVAGAAEGAP